MSESMRTIFRNGDIQYLNEYGQLHREDGPAVIYAGGRHEYWLNGEKVTEADVIGASDYPVDPNTRIDIGDAYDAFVININDKRFYFDQEDTREKLVDVFRELGFKNVHYEEIY